MYTTTSSRVLQYHLSDDEARAAMESRPEGHDVCRGVRWWRAAGITATEAEGFGALGERLRVGVPPGRRCLGNFGGDPENHYFLKKTPTFRNARRLLGNQGPVSAAAEGEVASNAAHTLCAAHRTPRRPSSSSACTNRFDQQWLLPSKGFAHREVPLASHLRSRWLVQLRIRPGCAPAVYFEHTRANIPRAPSARTGFRQGLHHLESSALPSRQC